MLLSYIKKRLNLMKNKIIKSLILLIPIVLIFFAMTRENDPLYAPDSFLTDPLYSRLNGTDRNIVIIGVDEKTIGEYGNFNLWSREKLAELINKLYENEEYAPKVVGLDFILTDHLDEEADAALAKAAEGRNIVISSNVAYRRAVETDEDGNKYINKMHITDIEMPYEELRNNVSTGFADPLISPDGYVRYTQNTIDIPKEFQDKAGVTQDSFAYAIYKAYEKENNGTINTPRTNREGQFQFLYSGQSGEYRPLSLADVLSDKVPMENFKDAIVLVGAYAPGTQDSYQGASDRRKVMYGVEIHANIIQAYMYGKTMTTVNKYLQAAAVSLILVLFIVFLRKKVLFVTIPVSLAIAGLYLLAGRILSGNGWYISCIYLLIALAFADLYFILEKYLGELIANYRYQEEIKEQMWSFTEAMATAIDERTPYNASHTRNVAKYSGMIADYINKLHEKGEEEDFFSEQRKEQLVMGALLHDIGKLAIPLEVMNKETRLDGREKEIEKRLNTFKLESKISLLENKIDKKCYNEFVSKADEAVSLINKVNGMGFINDELRAELAKVMEYEYKAPDSEAVPFFTEEEKECLNIVKGTLTAKERDVMQSHVEITGRILSKVHFNKYFANSPTLAVQHHECLNGKGYPNHLTADDLSTDARIIAVADICDALIATDRPYKPPVPREKAFDIMRNMAKDGNIDAKLVEYLYECTKPSENPET